MGKLPQTNILQESTGLLIATPVLFTINFASDALTLI
jgi:hypothetical protein